MMGKAIALDLPFSPHRFSAYARDLSDAVYELSRMGSTSNLRARLNQPVDVRFGYGGKYITLNGKTVWVSAMATDDEIANALNVTPLPEVEMTPAKPPSNLVPSNFAASLRAMMDEARADLAQARTDGLSKVKDAVGKLTEAKVAIVQVTNSMAKTIEDEAASVTAELGQISNMGPE